VQEEKKRILKLVEEGKLSVEEALSLLELLEKEPKTFEQKQDDTFQELSNTVHFDEAKKEESVHQKLQSTKEKIFDFVDTAFKKMKDFDLDLNFGQSVEVSHIFHHQDVFIKNIDIEVANGSIKLIPWDQSDVRIECQAKVYRVDNQDEARQNFLKDTYFAIEGGKLRFHIQQKWMKVDAAIFVPQTQYDRIRARIFNGPISGSQLNVSDIKVKATNGKIDLSDFFGTKMEVETANGHIKIINSQFDDIGAETINGPIQLDGDYKKIEMQSFNGDLVANLTGNRCHMITAKATTGSTDVYVPEGVAVNGELKTNFGGFNVQLEGIRITEEKNEMIQKIMRFKSDNPTMDIWADTKTGTISVYKSTGVKPFK
jgi:DUF4097 and DUF4098 domain-containing protein YvlB